MTEQDANIDPVWLDTPTASRYLSLSESLLEKYRARGEGPPFVRLGRAVRYRREQLDQWMASQEV